MSILDTEIERMTLRNNGEKKNSSDLKCLKVEQKYFHVLAAVWPTGSNQNVVNIITNSARIIKNIRRTFIEKLSLFLSYANRLLKIQKKTHFYKCKTLEFYLPHHYYGTVERWYYTLAIQKVCTDSSLMKLKQPQSPVERGYDTIRADPLWFCNNW